MCQRVAIIVYSSLWMNLYEYSMMNCKFARNEALERFLYTTTIYLTHSGQMDWLGGEMENKEEQAKKIKSTNSSFVNIHSKFK